MSEEKSNAMPFSCYGDPAFHYEMKESQTCKGCVHELIVHLGDTKNVSCDLPLRKHGKRCKRYREKS